MTRYAAHADGIVETYLPPMIGTPSRPFPLVVLIHGGFWRQEFDRMHVRPLASVLAGDGWVVASVEYRRIGTGPKVGADRALGGWPTISADVATAMEDVTGQIQSCAPGVVDPAAPFTVAGHSAGGHLALWAGLRTRPSRVCRIVALAPVSDLVRAAAMWLGDGAVQVLLGGEPHQQPVAYAEADVLRLLPGTVPIHVIHGTADQQVPVELSRALAADWPELTYTELSDVDHFALIDPLSAAFPVVRAALRTP